MKLLNRENIQIFLFYILFGFGGLWHVLNMFQDTMKILASPLITIVCFIFVFDSFNMITKRSQIYFLWWSLIVFSSGLAIELMGVYTHFPFGNYQYGSVLKPQIFQVPVVIGFAWLTICLSSQVIAFKLIQIFQVEKNYDKYFILILTATFMLIFDLIMERAAPKLNYWTWLNNEIPVQNYFSWFFLGILFSWIWQKFKISIEFYTTFGIHVYVSQFIYFLIVIFMH